MLILILAQMSTNALADWSLLNGDDDFDMYVDLSTLQKTGGKVKIWGLTNNKTPKEIVEGKYLSVKVFMEYDCKETNIRALAVSFFTQNMGVGQPMSSVRAPTDWMPLEPDSSGRALWSAACEANAAEWTEIEASKEVRNGIRTYHYVDLGTATKIGEIAKIWYLADLRSVDPSAQSKNHSAKILHEVDCKNAQFRRIEALVFSGNMGLGTKTHIPDVLQEWEPTAIKSASASLSLIACRIN